MLYVWGMIRLLKKCGKGIKANLIPGVVLQLFGLAVVIGYYNVPYVYTLCEQLSAFKQQYGILFSAVSTCIAGGLIPVVFLILTKHIPPHKAVKTFIFYIVFWLWKGAEIDVFYGLQAVWFGDVASFKVISYKVLVDQLIWSPLYAAPCISLVYFWMDCNFSFSRFKKEINRDMFLLRIPTVVVSTWVVWFPMCAIIYSLPTPLQVPLFNIALCFFVLLVSIICDDTPHDEAVTESCDATSE